MLYNDRDMSDVPQLSGILKIPLSGEGQQNLVVNMKDESIRLNNIQTRFLNDLDISKAGQ